MGQVIVASMYHVATDCNFSGYRPNINSITITPSPTGDDGLGGRNPNLIDLLILKANCLVDGWEVRSAARKSGLSFQEFSSRVDTKGIADAWLRVWTIGACKTYEDAKFSYLFGDGTYGKAILTPFRTFLSDTYSSYYNYRR